MNVVHASYDIEAVCAELTISPDSYRLWEAQGYAPRRDVAPIASLPSPACRWPRISHKELERWKAQLELDRKKADKAWLRRPLEALSWLTPEERAAELEARAKRPKAAWAWVDELEKTGKVPTTEGEVA